MYHETYEQREEARRKAAEREARKRRMVLGASITGLIAVICLIGLFLSVETIKPGYEGLVYNRNGGIEQKTLGQGWHLVAPWKKVIQYSVATETVYLTADSREGSKGDDSYSVPTRDGKQIKIGSEFNYSYKSESLASIFTKFRGKRPTEIEDSFIKGKLKAWAGEITSQYTVIDLYGEKRAEVSKKVLEVMKPRFDEWGIEAEGFLIIEVIPDVETQNAIQKLIISRQELEQENIANEKEILKQKRLVTEAENKRIEAEGEKQKKIIEAQGEAESNRLKQATLTSELVQMEWIKKWDGQMPSVQGGSQMIQIPSVGK